MNKKSHLFVTRKIARKIPNEGRKWLLCGCILPDLLYHTYMRGHIWENSFELIRRKMYLLHEHGKNNRFSYLILGYILHYIEDFFTLAHNPVFKGSLAEHIRYEREFDKYLQEEYTFPCYTENDTTFSLATTLHELEENHDQYLSETGNFETDIRFIYKAADTVSNCLLRALEINSRADEATVIEQVCNEVERIYTNYGRDKAV